MELERDYAASSAVRFMSGWDEREGRRAMERLDVGERVEIEDHSPGI